MKELFHNNSLHMIYHQRENKQRQVSTYSLSKKNLQIFEFKTS